MIVRAVKRAGASVRWQAFAAAVSVEPQRQHAAPFGEADACCLQGVPHRARVGPRHWPAPAVRAHLVESRLVRVLADWCAPFPGYHLCYPSRRQPTPTFALLVEPLRFRG